MAQTINGRRSARWRRRSTVCNVWPATTPRLPEIQAEQAEAIIDALVRLAAFVLIDLPHMPSVASRAALRSAPSWSYHGAGCGCLVNQAWLELLRGIADPPSSSS